MANDHKRAGNALCSDGRVVRQLVVLVILLMLVPTASADAPWTLYLAGNQERARELVRDRIDRRFGDQVRVRPYRGETDDKSLVLTLDAASLAEVRANNVAQPVVALFSTRTHVRDLITNRERFSAVYSDPPLLRQARLGRRIIPSARTLAVLASPEEARHYEALMGALEELGLKGRIFVVESTDTLIRDLSRALSYGDFVLGTSESRIFNRDTVKSLLLTSYRRNRLVIGPNRAFVRAGSVASTYTPAAEQIRMGLDRVESWFEQRSMPEPGYPDHFRVALNHQVARSMNIPLPEEEQLREALTAAEVEQ